jgi:pyruvate dehydrogenase E2 component (dihydrolipoamide acetyltransferase)
MTTLHMPDLGTVEGTVTLVRWLKREGDSVALGEPLFEVETDKGVSEVECAAEGTLAALLVREGASVAAGDPIASIRGRGEGAGGFGADVPGGFGAAAQPAATLRVEQTAPPREDPAPRPAGAAAGVAPGRGSAPVLSALAGKWGVDLSAVKGSGPGGAVTRRDILRERDERRGGGAASARPAMTGLSPRQSVVAARVSRSHREKPVFHVTARVDMTWVIGARARLRFDAFFVKTCAAAIAEFPIFRRAMVGESVLTHEAVDIAVALGVGDDLFAPAVRAADRHGVQDISAQIDGLFARAQDGTLSAADSQGSCFLVSNLGMYPVESFDAVILPEHSAALAVGASTPTPVAEGVGVRIAPVAALTLSVDHRLINGAAAARFLGRVKELLEKGGWK